MLQGIPDSCGSAVGLSQVGGGCVCGMCLVLLMGCFRLLFVELFQLPRAGEYLGVVGVHGAVAALPNL